MGRKMWLTYAAFQTIGEVCQWSWPSSQSSIGPWLWGGAFFLLLPGSLVSGYVIEGYLWRTDATLSEMRVLQVPLALGINLTIWILGAWMWRRLALKAKMRSEKGVAGR